MKPIAMLLASLVMSLATVGEMVSAGAAPPPTRAGGGSIDVSAAVAGRWANPPGLWVNPCSNPYSDFRSNRFANDAGPSRGASRTRSDGVTERLWEVSCVDPLTGRTDPTTITDFWVAEPDPTVVVRDVFEHITDYLDPPTVTWPNMSEEHGWLFVKVPMDYRISNLQPVSVTATVSNALGSASATVTATPGLVTFTSGEGGGDQCTADQAREPYVPRSYGDCSYTYQNSSAIAPNGYSFGSTTTMRWDITSSPADPAIPVSLDTFVEQLLPVSEVQALVTCVGAGC